MAARACPPRLAALEEPTREVKSMGGGHLGARRSHVTIKLRESRDGRGWEYDIRILLEDGRHTRERRWLPKVTYAQCVELARTREQVLRAGLLRSSRE